MRATPPQKLAPSSSNSVESSPQVADARQALSSVRLKSASVASSDDEDLPSLDGPRKRLVRGKRTPDAESAAEVIAISSSPPPTPSSQGDVMTRLRAAAPGSSDEQLRFVLNDEGGNVAKAVQRLKTEAELLGDYKANVSNGRSAPSGSATNGAALASSSRAPAGGVPSSPVTGPPAIRGNKKSAIYAKRGTYDQEGRMKLCPICKKNPINAGYRHCSRPCALRDPQAKARAPVPAPPPKPAPVKRKRTDDSDSEGSVVMMDAKGKGKQTKDSDDSSDDEEDPEDEELERRRAAAIVWFNQATPDELIELTSCTSAQAQTIVSLRPFDDHADFRTKINRKKGIGYKVFETYMSVMEGYSSLDDLLAECEELGRGISKVVSKWAGAESLSAAASKAPSAVPSRTGSPQPGGAKSSADDAGIHLTQVKVADDDTASKEDPDIKGYIRSQPSLISPDVQLKDYQLLGVNWLNLLWNRRMSCILADEMGLGKTIQVIALLAHIKEAHPDAAYRHLVVVPPSTLENWVREFDRFAPELNVQTYYGTQTERSQLRHELYDAPFDVLVTTYNFAGGNEHDRKFFSKKMKWETCIFDEGHMLKNFQSQRYENLMKITAPWRLLLTGTPLQNNLQELVSLLNFIMPELFIKHEGSLRAIFKTKADTHQSFLSRDRVTRAKKMMTPFVLRRRKDQVLKDLPKKTERIEWCEMTSMQRTIYREALQRSRKTVQTLGDESQSAPEVKTKGKAKGRSKLGAMSGDTSSNVLMDLRKAASHPMLFRRLFDDAKLKVMAKHCLKEPEFCESNYNYVVEDMEVMTDAELQYFCKKYKSVNRHALDDDCYLAAGKISKLMALLEQYKADNKRVLIFSQFTQILDILQAIFKTKDIKYLVLTGSTAVDERQGLVDEFNEDEGISVFLLSTKAGGMGINLTAACVVIIFDQDFNPHNDKQACDRAYRIGQKRDVDIVKLITKGTIEEDMYRIGNTKLMLDDAVAGNGDDEGESKTEKLMKSSLLSVLRKQFEKEENDGVDETADSVENVEPTASATPAAKGRVTLDQSAPDIVIVDSDIEMADGEDKNENGRLEDAVKNAAIVV